MKRVFLLIGLITFSFSSCDKDFYTPIPYAPVYLNIDLDFLDSDLIPMFATKVFTQKRNKIDRLGYGGILVINGISQMGTNLYAYDLTCPVEVDKSIKIIPDEAGNAICPKCNEEYIIRNGGGIPTKGISKHPLRSYAVSNKGGNRFLISN
ncbi:hypothetical protein LJB92_02290 [Bacteroidales bacterium OttesenSCG-928-M06]|nr:hypothetical protein [Bacteroidales bacterium OttesenSCG-928-M06]